MSTTANIGNFYVDQTGKEQPIRFKSSDLVNKPAPEGYHWEFRSGEQEWRSGEQEWIDSLPREEGDYCTHMYPVPEWVSRDDGSHDYYICVKDKAEV